MDTLNQLIEMTVQDLNSEEVGNLLAKLPMDLEEANAQFCDIYELGNGVFDLFDLYGVKVREQLEDLGMQKMLWESEDMEERRERVYELQN